MDVLEAIYSRRSIRKYTNKTISDETINQIIKAGMYAPSARNQQTWHFIIIKNEETLKNIRLFHPYAKMTKETQLAILVCADENLEKSKNYWPVDCANASQNILLASHGLGLGAVWLGVYPRKERMKGCTDLFKLASNIHPFSLISIGYPNEKPLLPERYNGERIHIEKW